MSWPNTEVFRCSRRFRPLHVYRHDQLIRMHTQYSALNITPFDCVTSHQVSFDVKAQPREFEEAYVPSLRYLMDELLIIKVAVVSPVRYKCQQIEIDPRLGVTVSRACLIIADIIVLSLTWRSMYQQRRVFGCADRIGLDRTYSAVLMQDGRNVLHDAPKRFLKISLRDDLLPVRHDLPRYRY